MIGQIYHVGLTVSDLDRSVRFYRDTLGLEYLGEIVMEGTETDILFGRKGCKARVAYLNGAADTCAPPVELIQFIDEGARREPGDLFTTSISELCLHTDDAEAEYERLKLAGVDCLSAPQSFDFSDAGFGASKAFYFRDPDGIVLEMMQPIG